MKHALIIEDNLIVSKALEDTLSNAGFQSFDHAWTEEDAVQAARRHRPDLVIVGDHIQSGSGVEAARRIAADRDVPVMLVTADSLKARETLPEGASLDGPFLLRDMPKAIVAAA